MKASYVVMLSPRGQRGDWATESRLIYFRGKELRRSSFSAS